MCCLHYTSDNKKILCEDCGGHSNCKNCPGCENRVIEWDVKTGESTVFEDKTWKPEINTKFFFCRVMKKHWLYPFGSKLIEYNLMNNNRTIEVENYNGLLIQGIDMSNLHCFSLVTREEKEVLKQYGAIVDGEQPNAWSKDIVIIEQEHSKHQLPEENEGFEIIEFENFNES